MTRESFLCVEKWGKLGFSGAVYKSEAEAKEGKDATYWIFNKYPYFAKPMGSYMESRDFMPYTNKKQEKIVEFFKKGLEAKFEREDRQSTYYKGAVTTPVEVTKL